MQILHTLGARDLVFFGLGPMGCIPLQRVMTSSGDCKENTNQLAINFNKAANKLMEDLSNTLPNATFKFGDAYDVVQDVINNPEEHGAPTNPTICFKNGRSTFLTKY